MVLGLAACQTEPEGLDVNVGGEQLVTVNVTVPEAETRAGGNNSALGVFDNGVLGTADDNTTMRYILQVYLKNGEQFVQSDERLVEYSDGKTVNFEVRLVPGRDYQFVVWADVVTNGKQDIDNHYVTMDANKKSTLGNITLNGEWNAMDESRDAFTATELIDNYNGTKDIEIKLYRPFAKLRVVTTDMKALNNLGIVPDKATVTYSEKHYNAFNAFAGKAIGDSKNSDIKHENFEIASYGENVTAGADMTLFTDYFFAENDVTKFTLEVFDLNGKLIKKNDFVTDINVKRNYLTTIKGNILTDGNSFEVEIEDAFAGEIGKEDGKTFANIDTAEELFDAINKGVENITLEGNIDLNDLLNAGILSTRAATDPSLTVKAGENVTIDLGGYTLSATSSQTGKNYNMIDVRGTLTVKNGNIKYEHKGDNMGWNNYAEIFYVGFNGTLNLDGVNAENLGGSDMAYVIDMVNATNITVNVTNSTLKSTYIPIRVFNNSKTGVNNVTIKKSTLEGKYCFWVQYWLADGRDEATLEQTLKLDIFNSAEGEDNNTFAYNNAKDAPVLYGFDESVYIDEFGNQIVAEGVAMNADGEYILAQKSGMLWLAEQVNGGNDFSGKVVKLAADIDLNNENWTAIGTPEANFCGTFDGCDYTIKNLKIVVTEGKEEKAYLGLFGYAKDATIKNVVFENVDINVACLDIDHSQGHIGAVAGSLEGTSTIENVTVKGNVKVYATQDANGASRVAVIAGGNTGGNVTMKNVHIVANEGSYLKANNNVGALAGQLQSKSVFENCTSNIDVTGMKFFAGGIIGLAAGDQTFTNCHTTGDITITQGREGKAHDHFRVGGIAGGWADNVKTPLVITNCSYTGKVSGKDFNGNEANPLDYAGYVGRGYTLSKAGTTVNIDGTRYVQKYDGADKAGIYDVTDAEGNVVVSTFAEFQAALQAGGNIALGADIALDNPIQINNKEFYLNGRGHKIGQSSAYNIEGTSTAALIHPIGCTAIIENIVFDGIKGDGPIRTVDTKINIKNITVQNCERTVTDNTAQGLFRLHGESIVTACTFKNNICPMGVSLNWDGNNDLPQSVTNCVFEGNTCHATAVLYYVKGSECKVIGNKFVDNTVTVEGGKNAATVYMGFTENNVITDNLFKNNTVNAGTSRRVAGGIMIGYEAEITGNAFIGNSVTGENAIGNDVCASVYYTDIDLSGNYWGGGAPVENDDYFVEYTNYKVIVNDYLTENPIK